MSTLSIPITPPLEEFINRMVKSGAAATKADVVRKALACFEEEQAVADVLRAEQELKEGKILRGDLREIVRRMP